MANQQFFGGLLAVVAVAIAYVGFKSGFSADRIKSAWAALIGNAASPSSNSNGSTTASAAGTLSGVPGGYKYVAGMGKAGQLQISQVGAA